MTFQQALLRRGIPFRTSPGDNNKTHIHCPFCGLRGKSPDTQFRLCVHSKQGWGRCMHCDWKHRYAIGPVLKQLGLFDSVTEGLELVIKGKVERVTLPRDYQLLTNADDDLDYAARQYLLKRGVSPKQIRENKIGVSFVGRYAYRVIFPVYEGKQLQALNARDFTGIQVPKYLNSKGEKYLFGFDPEKPVCICSEGAIKALRLAQAAPDFASAALLGHDLTDVQEKQILDSRCKEVLIYPDPDYVGRKGALSIAEKLLESRFSGSVKILWPVTKPADEASVEELKKAIANPQRLTWKLKTQLSQKSYNIIGTSRVPRSRRAKV